MIYSLIKGNKRVKFYSRLIIKDYVLFNMKGMIFGIRIRILKLLLYKILNEG